MIQNIDQLCKGYGGVNIKRVIENCAKTRRDHRFVRSGYSPKRTHRYLADIPAEYQLRNWTCNQCYSVKIQGPHLDLNQRGLGCKACKFKGAVPNPYYNYFHPDHDKHERKKHRYQFLKKNPEFMCVDKL